ncbi:MAG: hypothetical protein EOS10_24645 [Mesorhizobium sp.]|uniref:hypothetical protein n=1 Tax=Mesorhizobium sp. TaxID=1871066 RepID=UPI000FE8E2C3|nr:hypothetical protein [Mesorhizobium sp.]RWO28628.1 MAG: hypothetical protein EOS10_24645 [Mesorhizobium sp.]
MITQRFINIATVVYVVLAVAGAVAAALFMKGGDANLPPANFPAAVEKALTLSTDLTKQLFTLATALIGGCIWLLTRPLTDEQELKERLVWTMGSLLLFGASLYFGFSALDAALTQLRFNSFDAFADMVWWPQTLQLYAFAAGALLLGLACVRSINAVIERK